VRNPNNQTRKTLVFRDARRTPIKLARRLESASRRPGGRLASFVRQKTDGIRRAAFQKPRLLPIFMKKQRKFAWAPGFCDPLRS